MRSRAPWRDVPRPALLVDLLMLAAFGFIVLYVAMGPEAGSVWCWSASTLCVAYVVEPSLIRAVGVLEVEGLSLDGGPHAQPCDLANRPRAVKRKDWRWRVFESMWAHMKRVEGPDGRDRQPWRSTRPPPPADDDAPPSEGVDPSTLPLHRAPHEELEKRLAAFMAAHDVKVEGACGAAA